MNVLQMIAIRIIKEQERIIGPVAWNEARKVRGLQVISDRDGLVELKGDPKRIIDRLVAQYDLLFGRASHEVCKEAALPLLASLPPRDIPSSLR